MKDCPYCNQPIEDESTFCPMCGKNLQGEKVATSINAVSKNTTISKNGAVAVAPWEKETPKTKSTLAILAMVFSVLACAVGLVLGVVGLCVYKNDYDDNRELSCAAIIVSLFVLMLILAICL